MIRTLLALLPADRRRAALAHIALTVVSVTVRALAIVVLVPLIGALFGPAPAGAWPWLGLLAAATAAGWLIDAVIARIGFDLGFALLETAQHRIAERLVRIRMSWLTAETTATARQAIAATGPDLVGIVVYLLTPLLSGLLLPVALALALLPLAWPLGLAALIGVPLLGAAFVASTRIGRAADRAAAESNTALTERIVEFARTQQALRAARRSGPARSLVGQALATQHAALVRVVLLQVPGQVLFGLASQLALAVLAGTTAWLTLTGRLGVPEAIALIVVIIRYLEPFTVIAGLAPAIETTTGVLRTIRAVLDAPVVDAPDDTPPPAVTTTPASAPEITLAEVDFRYPGSEVPVLERLDLTLAAGTTTAIVGPSGSGKSTILSLIAGLHQPSAGRVLIDGLEAGGPAAVSVVFQHPHLVEGTIRANVLTGDPGADEAKLGAVAELARLDEVLGRVPGGWDAEVGEGGRGLSGGERQRVSIARALAKPAPILLVDEATSALDAENEAAIVRALSEDPVPRTRIVVAHRLASIRTADRVLFVEAGRIVEDGTVETLLAAGGRFADFWADQDAAATWTLGRRG